MIFTHFFYFHFNVFNKKIQTDRIKFSIVTTKPYIIQNFITEIITFPCVSTYK